MRYMLALPRRMAACPGLAAKTLGSAVLPWRLAAHSADALRQPAQMNSQGQPESPNSESSTRPPELALFGFVRFPDPLFSIT